MVVRKRTKPRSVVALRWASDLNGFEERVMAKNVLPSSRISVERRRYYMGRRFGTARKGVKLTARDVVDIRAMLAQGRDRHTIAYWYMVTDIAIWQIQHGKTWGRVL